MKNEFVLKFLAFCLIFCVTFVESTISPSSRGKKAKEKEIKINVGPIEKNVFDRNLVDIEPVARDILMHHASYSKETSRRLFKGDVLGFVTPVIVFLPNESDNELNQLLFFSGTIMVMMWQRSSGRSSQ